MKTKNLKSKAMKRLLIISCIFVLGAIAVKAQQLPMYSQYMFNGFLLNPAETGTDENFPIRLTARDQWEGINGAPLTMALSGHYMFASDKVGVGGFLFRDQFGPVARTGILAAYAYHIDLHAIKSRMSFGLSAMAFQYSLNGSDLDPDSDESSYDPALSGANESAIVPDANFGMRLYNDRYFVGIAGTQLVQFPMNLGNMVTDDTKMVRHYFGTAGYKFVFTDMFHLEPSILLKATERSPLNLDFNIRAIYDETYWLGASFRSDKEIVVLLGLKYKAMIFGYAFDYGFTSLYNYAKFGSHEIMIGVNLKDQDTGSTLF